MVFHIFLGCRVSSSDPWWSWDSLSQALQCQWREVPPLLGLDPRADGCDRNKQTCRSLEGTQTDQLVLTLAKPRAGFRQSRRQHSLCWSSYLSWMWFELSWEGRTLLDCVSPLCLPWNRPAGVKCYCLWCLKTLWPREKFPVLCAWHVIIVPVCAVKAVSFHSLSQQMPVKYPLF